MHVHLLSGTVGGTVKRWWIEGQLGQAHALEAVGKNKQQQATASKLSPGSFVHHYQYSSAARSGLETEQGIFRRAVSAALQYQDTPEQDPELYSIWNKPGM
jgi:hypothetical protein